MFVFLKTNLSPLFSYIFFFFSSSLFFFFKFFNWLRSLKSQKLSENNMKLNILFFCKRDTLLTTNQKRRIPKRKKSLSFYTLIKRSLLEVIFPHEKEKRERERRERRERERACDRARGAGPVRCRRWLGVDRTPIQ